MEFLNNLSRLFIYDPAEPLVFSSGSFMLLFIVFLTIYNIIYKRKILVSIYVVLFSFLFYYKSAGIYVWLLAFTTLYTYYSGFLLKNVKEEFYRKLAVFVGISIPLLLLGFFKYTNFIVFNLNQIIDSNFAFIEVALPVGISFYTFQSISYIIDLYRKRVEPADNILDFAFYLTFFPQLVAGPIVKANLFLPQLKQTPVVTPQMAYSGLWLIILGLFKKAVIANYIAQYNDLIFEAPQNYSGFENLMAVFGYALQIFCDFSGYSDMAIGIGKIMGYDLGINFLSPYKSTTISDFWRRWHISLSSWLKEYVYIPLGGNREISKFSVYSIPVILILASAITCPILYTVSMLIISLLGLYTYFKRSSLFTVITLALSTVLAVSLYFQSVITAVMLSVCIVTWLIAIAFPDTTRMIKTCINQLLTMLIGGLWHGSSWSFVFWGAGHGVALCIDKILKKVLPETKLVKTIQWIFTFIIVLFLWLFFRAKDITIQTETATTLVSAFDVPFLMLNRIFTDMDFSFFVHFWDARCLWVVLVVFGFTCHFLPENFTTKVQDIFVKSNILVKILVLLVVIQLVVQFQGSTVQPFIYFDF